MLRLHNIGEIETLLLAVPTLIGQLENGDLEFVFSVKRWLAAVERALTNNRLPAASEIAVLRGAVISVERGHTAGATAGGGRGGRRRGRDATIANLLRTATEVTANAIRARRSQLEEAETVARQVVAAASHLGLIPPRSTESHTSYLESVLKVVSSRPELTNYVVHITGLLGHGDTLVMLDRATTAIER